MRVGPSNSAGWLFPFLPVLFVVGLRAETAYQSNANLKDPQFIAEGAKIFAVSCGNAYCHGTGGSGGGAPRIRGKGLDPGYTFKTISNGVPNTSMPGFKTELSEDQIWRLVAFIAADPQAIISSNVVTPAPPPASATKPAAAVTSPWVGNAQAGKALFFDSSKSKSCHACHSFKGEGTQIGPDLSSISTRSARALFSSIVLVNEIKDPKYAVITITLRSGEKVVGVKKEEDVESLRVYDTSELPAVLRTIQKTDVATIKYSSESVMPRDYASAYTMKQLLDLVTFLKSADSTSSVTLKDLLE